MKLFKSAVLSFPIIALLSVANAGIKNIFTRDEVLYLKDKLATDFPNAYLPK